MTHFFSFSRHRLRIVGLTLLADLTGLALAAILETLLDAHGNSAPKLDEISHLIGFFSALSLFMTSRLYPGTGINPSEEIRLAFIYTFIALLFSLLAETLLEQEVISLARLYSLFLVWLFSLTLTLALRWALRIVAVQWGWWKEPALIAAFGDRANTLASYFFKRLRLGYAPAVILTDEEGKKAYRPQRDEILLTYDEADRLPDVIHRMGIDTALVDLPAAAQILSLSGEFSLPSLLPRLIIISDLRWLEAGASLHSHDFEGLQGVEIRQAIIQPLNLALKTMMDYALAFVGLILLLPLFAFLALLIKLDSAGPAFYIQERVGKSGHKIKIFKFRTMIQNADAALQDFLRANPAAQAEWDSTQKLKNDPRITRLGGFLRKFSLDELPQVINVCKGEMSLVGPRPITPSQIEMYGEKIKTYYGMKPGMSGLWQVSGRNYVTFAERVQFDVYYAYNWSVWLDIYILLRTVWVVFSRHGAY